MKRILSVSLTLAVLATVLVLGPISKRPAFTVHAHGGCSVATLNGNYGFTFSGFQLQSPGAGQGHPKSVPFYGEGLATFDGAGNFSLSFIFSQNGALPGDRYVTGTSSNDTGTYTVNPDCTGSTVSSSVDNIAFVIVNGGAEILATDISEPDTLNVDFKKQ